VQAMIAERSKRLFTDTHDFLARTHFPRDVIETLAMSDVFACFGQDQRHTFWKSVELRTLFERKASGQLSLFDQADSVETKQQVFAPMTLFEGIIEDYRGLGYSLRGNAMKGIRQENLKLPKTNSQSVKAQPNGSLATYAGMVLVLQRPPTANGVAFMTLEDEFGSVDLVFFPKVYERYLEIIRKSRFLLVKGKMERRGTSVSLLVGYATTFDGGIADGKKPIVTAGQHPRSLGKFTE